MRTALPASMRCPKRGIDSIERGSFLDARSLKLFIVKDAFHVPTIVAGVTTLDTAQGPDAPTGAAQR